MSEEAGDVIGFARRSAVIDTTDVPTLSTDALEAAKALCPGDDIYAHAAEWQAWWISTGRPRLGSPDQAFHGWLKTRKR